jgi:hypothetical protein
MAKKTTTETAPDVTPDTQGATVAPRSSLAPIRAQFRSMRRAGVSLCSVETADPAQTMREIVASLNGKAEETIICRHDLLNGLQGMNKTGAAYAAEVSPDGPIQSGNPAECLSLLAKAPPASGVVFMLGAMREIADSAQVNPAVVQGIWNLRDIFKSQGATLVLLSPGFTLPAEVARDVVSLNEPLPDLAELGKILDSITTDAEISAPQETERAAILDTLTGLSSFEAEQVTALAVTAQGIDRTTLWDRKVKAIESTPGLSVYRGTERLADYAGGRNAARLYGDTLKGALRCSCLVFIDEADKGMAAAGTDSSGTTQDQSKALLTYTQDNDILGGTLLGPPGTGKSFLMKCLAGEYGLPLIMLDLGALKGSLVGQSEQNMRQALKVIHAISAGRAFFGIACNRDAGLPPEFRRRFSYITVFFDLPDREEKDAAWQLHSARLRFQGKTYSLRPDQCDRSALNDDGWTGAEIRNCCLKAFAMDTTLQEAARSIVPISKSAAEMVTASRKGASGRYISASRPEIYTYSENQTQAQAPTGRRMNNTP